MPHQTVNSNSTTHFGRVAKISFDYPGERGLHRRRLRQQARRRDRHGQRQDQALLGRVRPRAVRLQPRPLQPRRADRAAVPQSGALRRADARRPRLRLRPRERPHPGVQEERRVREREDHQAAHARRRLGVGHRVLEATRRRSTSSSPTARTRWSTSWTASRWRSSRASATADGSRGSSSPCTASPPTRRATSTRPRRTRASGCRSSCIGAWAAVAEHQGVVWPGGRGPRLPGRKPIAINTRRWGLSLRLMCTCFTCRYSSTPHLPSSRPMPLCL